MDTVNFAQLLTEQRPHLERIVWDIARRYHLASHEIGEFTDLVDHALERNDYELLRAFDGRSGWETYLATIVTRLFFGFQAELWGKWRPSAAAQALGPVGVLLEELMVRDRVPLAEASQLMRTTHRVDLPVYRIEAMARELGFSHPGATDDRRAPEADARSQDPAIHAALGDAMALLSPEDRLLIAMRYVDRQPITRIAKVLKADARPLQRRIEKAKDVLQASLLTQGIAVEDVDALLRQAESDVSSPHRKWWMLVLPRPSNQR